jgi:hypothetical protein
MDNMTYQSSAYLPSYLQAPLMIKTNLDFFTDRDGFKTWHKNFTKAKLDEDLDFIGTRGTMFESLDFPPTCKIDKVLTIIKEVFNPVFDSSNLKREKQVG